MRRKQKQTNEEKLCEYLAKKYDSVVLSKEQLREELGIGKSTMDRYICQNTGIPPFKKLGNAKNARVVFNIVDVAKFLDNTIATNV